MPISDPDCYRIVKATANSDCDQRVHTELFRKSSLVFALTNVGHGWCHSGYDYLCLCVSEKMASYSNIKIMH